MPRVAPTKLSTYPKIHTHIRTLIRTHIPTIHGHKNNAQSSPDQTEHVSKKNISSLHSTAPSRHFCTIQYFFLCTINLYFCTVRYFSVLFLHYTTIFPLHYKAVLLRCKYVYVLFLHSQLLSLHYTDHFLHYKAIFLRCTILLPHIQPDFCTFSSLACTIYSLLCAL
jgi:hypothetical protein